MPGRSSATSKCVTASRGVSVSSEWRRRLSRSRPMGASMRPVRERGRPRTRCDVARARARGGAAAAEGRGRRPPSARRARRPEVSAVEAVHDSGPCGASPPAMSWDRRPWTSVPRSCPPAGCTTIPAGLSTTSRCSSSWCDPQRQRLGLEHRPAPSPCSSSSIVSPPLKPVALRGVARRRRARRRHGAAAPRRRASRRSPVRRGSGRAAWPADVLGDEELQGREDRAARRSGRRLRVRPEQAGEQDRHPEHDERVGEVEGGPVADVDEVGDVPEAHAVDEVRDAAADHEPERGRQDRMPSGGAREEKAASSRRRSPSARSRVGVALEKSPKAMPEFWTWWMANGPTTSRPLAE